jgi:hypothetical protein
MKLFSKINDYNRPVSVVYIIFQHNLRTLLHLPFVGIYVGDFHRLEAYMYVYIYIYIYIYIYVYKKYVYIYIHIYIYVGIYVVYFHRLAAYIYNDDDVYLI